MGLSLEHILRRLIEIGKIGGGARCTILDSDLVDQDQLFEFQEKFTALMVNVANAIPGPNNPIVKMLGENWPHIFKTERVKVGG